MNSSTHSSTKPETEALTAREREVLCLASEGLTNREIAARLGVKRNAVRYHLKEIHSKLDTESSRKRLWSFRDVRGWLGGLGLAKAAGTWAGMAGVVTLSTAGAFGVLYAHSVADPSGEDSPQYCYGEAMMTPAPGYDGPPPPTPRPSVCFDTREEAAAYEKEIGLIRTENAPCISASCTTPWRGGTPTVTAP